MFVKLEGNHKIIEFDLESNLLQFVPQSFPWCWKRDDGPRSRTILFQPYFKYTEKKLRLVSYDIFYRHTGPRSEMDELYGQLKLVAARNKGLFETRSVSVDALTTIELRTCELSPSNATLLPKLLALSPRNVLPTGTFPEPTGAPFAMSEPFAIYCGSGVSYEAGLPTLSTIHEHFYVDSTASNGFIFGLDDKLPMLLADDMMSFIVQSARFYTECAKASPTPVHRAVTSLQIAGKAPVVLTDNVDLLLEKAGARTIRVRTTFPHADGVPLPAVSRMLVVGVAADRRGIIANARAKGMTIHIVNPMSAVSPRAQNLSYIQATDAWYQTTASEFFSTNMRVDHD